MGRHQHASLRQQKGRMSPLTLSQQQLQSHDATRQKSCVSAIRSRHASSISSSLANATLHRTAATPAVRLSGTAAAAAHPPARLLHNQPPEPAVPCSSSSPFCQSRLSAKQSERASHQTLTLLSLSSAALFKLLSKHLQSIVTPAKARADSSASIPRNRISVACFPTLADELQSEFCEST